MAAQQPDAIVLKRHRDLEGRTYQAWVRRGLLVLVTTVPLLALFNVFGQRPAPATAHAPEASLQLYAPSHVRGGLIYEARFRITAKSELKNAILVLDRGWLEGQTVNTIEPSPISEGSRDGKLVLELGHVPAGQQYVLYMQFQVNPTNVGHRRQDVRLYDDERLLLTYHRTTTVFP